MKFIALIHNNHASWEALTAEQKERFEADAGAHIDALVRSGELVGVPAVLAAPVSAKTVRVRDGVPAVSDGPFAEGKEHLAGFYVLDCESMERAVEIMNTDPSARHFAIEIRPIMHLGLDDQ